MLSLSALDKYSYQQQQMTMMKNCLLRVGLLNRNHKILC